MDPEKFEELKETIELRHLSPAINEETGAPVLSRVRNAPGLGYVHLETFVNALEEQALEINPRTLEITEHKAPPPPIEKPPTPPPVEKPPTEKPKEEPKPPLSEDDKTTPPTTTTPGPKLYTKAELEKLSYRELQAIAKKDPEVPADKKKTELIKLLTGRPIL